MMKRFLAMMLAMVMVLSLLPTAALAVDGETGEPAETQYTVVFNRNHRDLGSGWTDADPSSVTVKSGDKVSAPSTPPTRKDFTFGGWYQKDGITMYDEPFDFSTPINESLTTDGKLILFAEWIPDTYEVTYDGNGKGVEGLPEINPQYYERATAITTASAPTREGFTFVGWNAYADGSGRLIEADKERGYLVTGDQTLYAIWECNHMQDGELYCKVDGCNHSELGEACCPGPEFVYHANFGEDETKLASYKYGERVTLPGIDMFSRDGYTLAGWDVYNEWGNVHYTYAPDQNIGSDYTKVENSYLKDGSISENGEVHFYAQWAANTYTVTFDANGGDVDPASKSVTFGSVYGELPVPTRTDYTFQGWCDAAGNKIDAETSYEIADNSTLTAQWKANPVATIAYNPVVQLDKDGKGSVEVTVNASNLPAISDSEGYWFYVKLFVEGEEEPVADKYMKADGATLTYTFTLNDGETYAGKKLFAKVFDDDNTLHAESKPGEELVLNYTYAVTFMDGETEIDTKYVAGGNVLTDIPAPSKDKHDFLGWFDANGEEFDFSSTAINNDIVVTAKWQLNELKIVRHFLNGDKASGPLKIGKAYTLKPAGANTIGYSMTKWVVYDENGVAAFEFAPDETVPAVFFAADKTYYLEDGSEAPYGEVHFYGNWGLNNYTVTFRDGENTNTQYFVYSEEQKLTKNAFTKIGYHFIGWATEEDGTVVYTDEQPVNNLTAENNGNVNLYAVWEANEYTINFDKNTNKATGAMDPQSFTYDEAEKLTPNAFTRKGYTFVGWATEADGAVAYADEAEILNLTAENGKEITLYAVWEANAITFTFNVVGNGTVKVYNDKGEPVTTAHVDDILYYEIIPAEDWRVASAGFKSGNMDQSGLTIGEKQIFKANIADYVFDVVFEQYIFNVYVDASGEGVAMITDLDNKEIQKAETGKTYRYFIQPADRWRVKTAELVSAKGTTWSPLTVGEYKNFKMDSADRTLKVEFEQYIFDLKTDVSGKGTVKFFNQNKEEIFEAETGEIYYYFIEPAAGWQVKEAYMVNANGTKWPNSTVGEYKTFKMDSADRTLVVEFEPISYNITVEANEGGVVEVKKTGVCDEQVPYSIVPDKGYKVVSAHMEYQGVHGLVKTTLNENGWFWMPAADAKVVVEFAPIVYIITVAPCEGGTVEVQDTAVYDEQVPYSIVPDKGYKVVSAHMEYQGEHGLVKTTLTENGKFWMPAADATVVVEFAPNVYNITVLDAENGSITVTVNGEEVTEAKVGDKVKVTVTPDEHYKVGQAKYSYTNHSNLNYGTFTFIMPADDVTVSARFDPIMYSITVNQPEHGNIKVTLEGETVTSAQSGKTVKVEYTADEGYKVAYRRATTGNTTTVKYNDFEWTMSSDVTFSATISPIEYTVEYTGEEIDIDPITVKYDEEFTLPTPTRDRYEFLGWKHGETIYDAGTSVKNLTTEDGATVELVAQWKQVVFDITVLDAENGTITVTVGGEAVTEAKIGDKVKVTVTPDEHYKVGLAKYSYSNHSNLNYGTFTFIMPADDVTVSARFDPIMYSITVNQPEHGNIKVTLDGETVTSAQSGKKIKVEYTADEGYKVAYRRATTGNTTTVKYNDFEWTMSADVTFSATISPIEYTVKYTGEAIDIDPFTVKYDEEFTLPTPTRDRYEFLGWKLGETIYDAGTSVKNLTTEDGATVELVAQWKQVVFDITVLDAENGTITVTVEGAEVTEAKVGDKVKVTVTPDEHYKVGQAKYSYTNHSNLNYGTFTFIMPADDVTVSARFDPIMYSITVNQPEHGKIKVTLEGEEVTSAQSGKTVKVEYTADEGYKVAYRRATTGNTTTVKYNDFEWTMSADVTFSATISPIEYTVKYTGEAIDIDPITVKYDEEFDLPAPERIGYTFKGWENGEATYAAGETVSNLTAVDGDTVTLTAIWEANTYKIYLRGNGGLTEKGNGAVSQNAVFGEETTLRTNPFIREGYIFQGWSTAEDGEVEYTDTITLNVAKNLHLYAVWTANTYTVKFDANSDKEVSGEMADQGFTYDVEAALTKNAFTKVGYTFAGWNTAADGSGDNYADETAVKNLTAEAEGVVTLYAQWIANTYTVKFDANSDKEVSGEMADQGFTYDVEDALTKNAFTKIGYTFAGWNTAADGSGDNYADEAAVKNLTAEADGVVTLYAQWIANTYTVKFDANSDKEVSGEMADQGFTYDVEAALTKNAFTKIGHTFTGWNTAADGSGDNYADEAAVKNLTAEADGVVTLYAQWEVNQYKLIIKNHYGMTVRVELVNYGEKLPAIRAPFCQGYVFIGWKGGLCETMPAHDVILYPSYRQIYCGYRTPLCWFSR